MKISCFVCVILFAGQPDESSFGQSISELTNAKGPVALNRVNEMVKCGDPQAVPILRHWLATDTNRVKQDDTSSRLVRALEGLGMFGDRHLQSRIIAIYRRQDSAVIVRNSAAGALARMGTREDLELLKEMVWDPRLTIQSRCASAVTLLTLDVPEAAEFLLTQYDLYRLERRTTNRWHLDPVRTALERVDNKQILVALEERLKDERHIKMQNNIRTLKQRMLLNGLPLEELRRIAVNPDWKAADRRYPVIEVLGARGDLKLIPFLESLKPWQTDIASYKKRVEGHNLVTWPQYVKDAIGGIRRRHWEAVAELQKQQPDLLKSLCAAAPQPKVAVNKPGVDDKKPSFEALVGRLKDPNFSIRHRALSYVGSMKPYPEKLAPHVIRLLKDPHHEIRSDAANSLGNLQNALPELGTRFPECIPQLTEMLSDKDPEDRYQKVRRFAAYALRHLGKPSKPAVPELLKIARNREDNASVRMEAVSALGSIGDASSEVVDTLTGLLDDQSRINDGYPTIASSAYGALGRLGVDARSARPILIRNLRHPDAQQRMAAAHALGTVGFGSLEAEHALLDLLNDKSAEVQKSALSALEGVNETNAFFFRHRVNSSEVSEKRRALLVEIRRDRARKSRFAQLLAAQLRLGEGHHPRRADALRRLFDLDARDHLPLIRKEFARLEKKTVYLEWRDLRMQLLRTLVAWLPEKDVLPFLIVVDSDVDEAPQVRFRAAVLLCERGDDALSIAYLDKRHFMKAGETGPLLTVDQLRNSLKDRRLFESDEEFDTLKSVAAEQLTRIQNGIQLAQYFYNYQQRGKVRGLSVVKVVVKQKKIDSIRCSLAAQSQGWKFELRRKGDHWLPCEFEMAYIQ